MNDVHADPDLPADDPLDAGLRAAFGPGSTVDPFGGGAVLATLCESSGVVHRVLLQDEPDEGMSGVVCPGSPEAAAVEAEPGRGAGRYDVAGELARGGIGVVLKGRDRDLGRDVALKVLRAEHAANPAMVRRLVEEAQIGGQLQHPGVLPVYELGLDAARRPFFSMKLVRGRTLAALLDERVDPARDRRRFLAIFEQVAQTVAYAHARGVIHRDLKPSNVMVGSFGEVQVVDWGLAKVLARGGVADESGPGRESVTTVRTADPADSRSEAGSVLGTPSYMAPEQARGEVEALDERCDVFALGALLCEVLTGRPPYLGTRDEVLRQARGGDLAGARVRLNACDADPELVALAVRCLDPRPEGRYGEAGQVARAVGSYLASADERARAAERDAASARAVAAAERRARRLTLALTGATLAALVAVGLATNWGLRQRVRAAEAEVRAGRERLRAEAEQLHAEREYRARVEGSLEVLLATEGKGQFLILQAAEWGRRDPVRWADLLATCRTVAERVADATPDPAARRRALELAGRLLSRETELRRGAAPSPLLAPVPGGPPAN